MLYYSFKQFLKTILFSLY